MKPVKCRKRQTSQVVWAAQGSIILPSHGPKGRLERNVATMSARCLFILIVSIAYASPAVRAQPLDSVQFAVTLNRLLDDHVTAARTTVALRVIDPSTGQVLFDRLGERLLVPASNLKIYTTACVIDQLGPDHRFQTRVQIHGTVSDGRLNGDIVLVGGGDAMLSTAQLGELAGRVVSELKIRNVNGNVVVDNTRYRSRLKGPGWMWDDDPDYYNMSVTPLMLDFNVLRVRMTPGGNGAIAATLVPPADYPPLVPLADGDSPTTARITREPFTAPILYGLPGTTREVIEERITPHDPGLWIASVFQHMLRERGVQFTAPRDRTSDVHSGRSAPRQELVYSGVTLATAVRHFNRVSENAVGEVLLHELAAADGPLPADWPAGAQIISDWLIGTAGLESGSFRLVDGSGLSRYNLISAESATRLLGYMLQHRHFDVFYDSLPRYDVAVDAASWPEKAAIGKATEQIAAKPGGMTSVATISGYAQTLDGRRLVFSLLANGYIGSNEPIMDLRQRVFQVLVRYRE